MANRAAALKFIFKICLLVILFIPANRISAQQKVISALIKPDTTQTGVIYGDTLSSRSGEVSKEPLRSAKSGNLAMLFSAILPGAGQLYAHRLYTIPIIWGFGAYFVSQWIKADNTYRDLKRQFTESVQLDTVNHIGNTTIQDKRNEWRNFRDGFTFYLIITYLLNIVDAYVGATLYNFDVSNDLDGGSAEIRFRIPFR